MRFNLVRVFLTLAAFLGSLSLLCAQDGKKAPDFDRRIAPLLAEHCLHCHGGPAPKGGLDLTTRKSAFKVGKRGPVLVPGKLEESLLWERVDADQMPPKHPLSAKEKAILKSWIEAGAAWGTDLIDPFRLSTSKRAGYDWWSLQPVRRPPPPTVLDKSWPRNPIDHFIRARLEAEGLSPSPQAERRTLLRRLSFDLIGMPPTPEEVETFAADKRPDAYERQVEHLLASPHYGERWARHWLDVVRFGESDGFERNGARPNAWHYRDWLVRALNADLPYDQFCKLQIAGDVLFPGDLEGLKATGYLVAGLHNTVVPMSKTAQEMAFQDELEDLIGNVGQTFLGLTANCARCHDHKFDPISQKDYYRLAAALSGVNHGERDLIEPKNQKELERLAATIAQLDKELLALEAPVRAALLAERMKVKKPGPLPPAPLAAWDFRVGLKDLVGAMHVSLQGGAGQSSEGLAVDGKKAFARSAPLSRALREKTLEAWVRLENLEQRGGGVLSIETDDGNVFDAIVFGEKEPGQWMAGSDGFRRTGSFAAPAEKDAGKRIVHVAITYQTDGTISGYRDGKPYGKPYRGSGLAAFPAGKTVALFGLRHEPAGGNRLLAGVIQKARLYDRALTAEEIALSAEREDFITEGELSARLDVTARKRRDAIRSERASLAEEQLKLQVRLKSAKVYAAVPKTPAPTRVLARGQVTEPGEVVAPGGVAALMGPAADFNLSPEAPEGERRRKLAEWITHPENPLFARALVNRLWHYHFGLGLVETPSDFGFNGGRPSHPELLDWLAAEFAAHKYSLKAMHRLIVTSAAYRQASAPRKEGLVKDADARWLWRKKPLRLEGEALRDGMLAVAGLLNPEIGGKGFSDYKESGGAGTNYYDPFDPVGAPFQRRSLYRFQPRGASLGLLDAFDCPDPASSAPRRNTTTTPLQALVLWNGPFALRMAEAFAERIQKEAPGHRGRQVERAYGWAYQRLPSAKETELAVRLVEGHGLRALCRALLNSNEFLTVE